MRKSIQKISEKIDIALIVAGNVFRLPSKKTWVKNGQK